MSQLTPCEELGYEVGDVFEVDETSVFTRGSWIMLVYDDGTSMPKFQLVKGSSYNGRYRGYEDLEVIDRIYTRAEVLEIAGRE